MTCAAWVDLLKHFSAQDWKDLGSNVGGQFQEGHHLASERLSGWEKLKACMGKRALQRVTRQEKYRECAARIHGDAGGLCLGRLLRRWIEPTLL